MTKRPSNKTKRIRRYLESWFSIAAAIALVLIFGTFIWMDQVDQNKKIKLDHLLESIDRDGDAEIEIDEFHSKARSDYAAHWLTTVIVNSYWREQNSPSNIDAIYEAAKSGEWPKDLSVRLGFIFSEMDKNHDAHVDRNELKRWVQVKGG